MVTKGQITANFGTTIAPVTSGLVSTTPNLGDMTIFNFDPNNDGTEAENEAEVLFQSLSSSGNIVGIFEPVAINSFRKVTFSVYQINPLRQSDINFMALENGDTNGFSFLGGSITFIQEFFPNDPLDVDPSFFDSVSNTLIDGGGRADAATNIDIISIGSPTTRIILEGNIILREGNDSVQFLHTTLEGGISGLTLESSATNNKKTLRFSNSRIEGRIGLGPGEDEVTYINSFSDRALETGNGDDIVTFLHEGDDLELAFFFLDLATNSLDLGAGNDTLVIESNENYGNISLNGNLTNIETINVGNGVSGFPLFFEIQSSSNIGSYRGRQTKGFYLFNSTVGSSLGIDNLTIERGKVFFFTGNANLVDSSEIINEDTQFNPSTYTESFQNLRGDDDFIFTISTSGISSTNLDVENLEIGDGVDLYLLNTNKLNITSSTSVVDFKDNSNIHINLSSVDNSSSAINIDDGDFRNNQINIIIHDAEVFKLASLSPSFVPIEFSLVSASNILLGGAGAPPILPGESAFNLSQFSVVDLDGNTLLGDFVNLRIDPFLDGLGTQIGGTVIIIFSGITKNYEIIGDRVTTTSPINFGLNPNFNIPTPDQIRVADDDPNVQGASNDIEERFARRRVYMNLGFTAHEANAALFLDNVSIDSTITSVVILDGLTVTATSDSLTEEFSLLVDDANNALVGFSNFNILGTVTAENNALVGSDSDDEINLQGATITGDIVGLGGVDVLNILSTTTINGDIRDVEVINLSGLLTIQGNISGATRVSLNNTLNVPNTSFDLDNANLVLNAGGTIVISFTATTEDFANITTTGIVSANGVTTIKLIGSIDNYTETPFNGDRLEESFVLIRGDNSSTASLSNFIIDVSELNLSTDYASEFILQVNDGNLSLVHNRYNKEVTLTDGSDTITLTSSNITDLVSRRSLDVSAFFVNVFTTTTSPLLLNGSLGGEINTFGGNDDITIDLSNFTIQGAINLGDGDDKLTLRNVIVTTISGSGNIDGGSGENTLIISSDDGDDNVEVDSITNFANITKIGDGNFSFNSFSSVDNININGGRVTVNNTVFDVSSNINISNAEVFFSSNTRFDFDNNIASIVFNQGSIVNINLSLNSPFINAEEGLIDVSGLTLKIRNVDSLEIRIPYLLARFGQFEGNLNDVQLIDSSDSLLSKVNYYLEKNDRNELQLIYDPDREISDVFNTIVNSPSNNQQIVLDRIAILSPSEEEQAFLEEIIAKTSTTINAEIENFIPNSHTTILPSLNIISGEVLAKIRQRTFNSFSTSSIGLFGPYNQLSNRKFWTDYNLITGTREGDTNGFDYSASSIKLGHEEKFQEFFIGFNLAYTKTNLKVVRDLAEHDFNSLSLGLYGYHSYKDRVYSTFSLIYTRNEINLKRTLNDDFLTGNTDGYAIDLSYAYSYQAYKGFEDRLLSSFGFSYTISGFDSFTEEGLFSTTTEGENISSLTSRLGVTYHLDVFKGSLKDYTLAFNVDWFYQFLNTDRDVVTQFNTVGDRFNVRGVDDQRNLLNIGLSWEMRHKSYIYLFSYNYNFNSIIQNHLISLKVDYYF